MVRAKIYLGEIEPGKWWVRVWDGDAKNPHFYKIPFYVMPPKSALDSATRLPPFMDSMLDSGFKLVDAAFVTEQDFSSDMSNTNETKTGPLTSSPTTTMPQVLTDTRRTGIK